MTQPLPFRQVHLDFHTSEKIVAVGEEFDAAAFADTLRKARVNSVTCFSRCHHGMIYHDTKFPARHPGLKINLLAAQIEACHQAGIRVPIYITVGLDEFVASRHPEWREVAADGRLGGASPLQPGWRKLCFNTPYIEYVMEQTQEVLELFGAEVDGLFFDIISQGPCCCRFCLAGMAERGLNPEQEGDRARFARQVLADFKRRMTALVRRRHSTCTIFYNAGHVGPSVRETLEEYTHLELESLPSGGWGYDHFPVTIRFARNLGVPCLGMTGKFQRSWGDFGGFKNQAALEYECFTALAEGAGCSVGDQLHPSGRLDPATYGLIGSVYAQVEVREPWCADARALAEVAIFTPEAIGREDGRVDTALTGAYRMLREAHYQCDVVDGQSDWSGYGVLVLPDKITLAPDLAAKVRAYAAGGGKLLMSHESGLDPERQGFVLPEMGVRYLGPARCAPDYLVAQPPLAEGVPAAPHAMYDRGFEVEAAPGAEVLADVWHPYFNRTYQHFCSHAHAPAKEPGGFPAVTQRGGVIYFAHPIFAMYRRYGARAYKSLVQNALRRLLSGKLIETDAPTTALITAAEQRGRTVIHVLHYIPERRSQIDIVEDVIPLHRVGLSIRLVTAPRQAYLAPQGEPLEFNYSGGRAQVVVPEVRGHQMVVFE